jgi:hypothetical protein
MPDFDFDAFNHEENVDEEGNPRFNNNVSETPLSSSSQPEDRNIGNIAGQTGEEVDKW